MASGFLSRLWDDQKSLTLTRWLVAALAVACTVAAACGPRIVAWLMHERTLNIQGPAVGTALLGMGYVCAALALGMLWDLYRFLRRLEAGQVFVEGNVAALRRISWYCALAAALCLGAGCAIYLPFAFLGCAAGFMALIVRVVKNAFRQAVRMKQELDYTV